MCQINMLVGMSLLVGNIFHLGFVLKISKHATMFIWHTRLIDSVEFVNDSATATEAHAADIDTTAVTDEINTKIPTKAGPIKARIFSCRSSNIGIDINLLLMISGSSCCFIK